MIDLPFIVDEIIKELGQMYIIHHFPSDRPSRWNLELFAYNVGQLFILPQYKDLIFYKPPHELTIIWNIGEPGWEPRLAADLIKKKTYNR